jgi:Tfp pilus assembly protein FimT
MKIRAVKKGSILQAQDGFTLLELVLIIVVVAILGAVIALNLSGLSTAKVNNAVKKVVSDLRYAQQLSITTQRRHGLSIDSAQQYSVHEDCGLDGICGNADDAARTAGVDAYVKDPTNLGQNNVVNFTTYQQGQLSGVQFNSAAPFCAGAPSNVIEFDKLGAPTDTAGTVMTCTSTIGFAGTPQTITIEPNTGSISY